MKELRIKYSKYIPTKDYYAICLFDNLIIRKEYRNNPIKQSVINHETIHAAQVRDFGIGFCGYFIFYIGYLLEGLIKLPGKLFKYDPYMNIGFEREAYSRDCDPTYLDNRKRFAGVKYVFRMRK